jgi:argininosuccinate lyase
VLETLTLEEYLKFDDHFDNEIYDAIDLKNCVERRINEGGTSVASVEAQVAFVKSKMNLL